MTLNDKGSRNDLAASIRGPLAAFWDRNLSLVGPQDDGARRLFLRYALAIALVLLALGLTLTLQQFVVGRPTLFLFFAAIVAAAWFGGAGPSGLAVLLSVPAGLYFYGAQLHSLRLAPDSVLLVLFCTTCALVGIALNQRQRRADQVLQKAHLELATKASELQRSNDALVAQISERARTELALHEAQSELARVARLTTMGELAASIAHELNQPLAAVVTSAGSCQRWLEGDTPNLVSARRATSRIVRDGNRASEVVQRIRAALRRAPPEKAPLDINSTIENVLPLIQAELEKNAVRPELRLAGDLPHVVGDRVQLQQVFLNLVINSIEAMSEVVDRPRLLTIETESRTDSVLITVRDTGEGIRTGTIDRLFDPFVTTKPLGMGLGLSICRTIIEAHGGTLWASPSLSSGAVFHVLLPAADRTP